MENLSDDLKKQLIEKVELILKPIDAKFVSFDNPFIIYSTIRRSGEDKNIVTEENKIVFYHFKVSTKHGEINMSICSDEMEKDINHGLLVSIGYSSLRNIVSSKDLEKINSNIIKLYTR